MSNLMRCRFLFFLLILLTGGCRPHSVQDHLPPVDLDTPYRKGFSEGVEMDSKWWEAFGSEELNGYVERACSLNNRLKKSWWEVAKACYQVKIDGARKIPEVISTGVVTHFRSNDLGANVTGGNVSVVADGSSTDYLLSTVLNYEVDLWQRVDSLTKSSAANYCATREDYLALRLALIGSVVEHFFKVQESSTLLKVIDHQIEVSKTQLELVELRFRVGLSSALDVYQQRLQLAQIQSEKPPVIAALRRAENALAALTGELPKDTTYVEGIDLPLLPPLPKVGDPVALLCSRPDLRASYSRILSADYQVAVALADRLPRLSLAISYDFLGRNLKDLFQDQISRIVGNLVAPLLDGGKRKAVVRQRHAAVQALLESYGATFLQAAQEVNDALSNELHQIELIQRLEDQMAIAKKNLEESQIHYINGLNDYLTVIAALQSLQTLERRQVVEKQLLLTNRSALYRALGGG